MRTLAYPDTEVLLIAFSIVKRDGFDNVKTVWIEEMKKYMRPLPKTVTCLSLDISFVHVYCKIILIGTKSDLKEDSKALELLAKESGPEAKPVTKGEGEALAKEINAYGYYETSAKTAEGVKEVMDAAIEAVEGKEPGCSGCCFM